MEKYIDTLAREGKLRRLKTGELLWPDIQSRMFGVSKAFYNRGLSFAERGHVSDAIDALERSLSFDKYNIAARNLLGLCYFKLGRYGDALLHWRASQEAQESDNLANEYIDFIIFNERHTDKINHSLQIYNSALDHLHNGNTDVAVMRLKKCVELNPDFVDALCLLALAYISLDQPAKGEPYIRRALQIDPSNEKALSYFAVISGGVAPIRRARGSNSPDLLDVRGYAKRSNRSFATDFRFSEVISFLVGCFLVAIAFIFLINPGREEDLLAQIERLEGNVLITLAYTDLAIAQIGDEHAHVHEHVAALQDELDATAFELSLLRRIDELHRGQDYLNQGDIDGFLMAYTVMYETSTEGFTPEQTEIHAQIWSEASARIENHYFQLGRTAFNRNQFAEANFYFNTALVYYSPDSPNAVFIYYYLGRIAEHGGNNTLAVEYFETVIGRYPGSARYNSARTRLDRLR